jgi:acetolactate synthase I/II/III large subunit
MTTPLSPATWARITSGWRHFFEFEPRKLLFSGQHPLGVGIPWAIAASLTYPAKKAVVGDGGFLYSSMELETAVRSKLNITVLVFRDGGYNMVAFQQELIYGRTSGTDFGNPDLVKYAESFGCVGMRVNTPVQLLPTLRKSARNPRSCRGRHADGLQQERGN